MRLVGSRGVFEPPGRAGSGRWVGGRAEEEGGGRWAGGASFGETRLRGTAPLVRHCRSLTLLFNAVGVQRTVLGCGVSWCEFWKNRPLTSAISPRRGRGRDFGVVSCLVRVSEKL